MADAVSPILLLAGGEPKRLQWIIHHITSHWPECVTVCLPAADTASFNGFTHDPEPDAIFLQVDYAIEANIAAALDCMARALRMQPNLHFIILATGGSELGAARAFKAGARDYLPVERISRELLLGAVAEAVAKRERITPTVAALAGAPASPAIDIEVPGYEILKTIAKGYFSSVYLARAQKLQRNVVLKVMSRDHSLRESRDEDRFRREYEIITSIQHPAIVSVHDFGTLPDHLYLCTEYFPCGDLRDRLRNPLSPAESLYYLRAIAEALRVIHVFGILHRDLKPGNVMLREDNSPVLIDFGLARRADDEAGATGIGKITGSPYYMSPEQAQGQRLDVRSDIYSLGVIFYEMLTGRRPYLGRSALAIMAQHTKSPVPSLSAELSAQQPVLERLMAKHTAERYSSVDELLADLTDPLMRVA